MNVTDAQIKAVAQRMLAIFDDKPERWTKDADARDADGDPVYVDDPDAVCFCLRGAAIRATDDLGLGTRERWAVLDALHGAVRGSVAFFNDRPSTSFTDAMQPVRKLAGVAA